MDNQISKLKLYLFILGFAFVTQVVFSVFDFRSSNTLHSSSLNSIDSLITEIGEIKSSNFLLSQEIEGQKELNQLNDQFLTQLTSDIESKLINAEALQQNLENYKNYLEKEKHRIVQENMELSNLLDNSSNEIETLKTEKEIKSNFASLNEKLYTLLLIGENKKLTDTILLVVVNPDKDQTTFVSLPRDLYFEGRKINEYSHLYGKDKFKEVITEISGLDVDNYIEFNFEGFIDVVDLMEGIDINVDKRIADERYPDGSFGYKTVVFEPGMERMDGERALEYGRSRKSTSDFDRSRRQQQVLVAIKEKLRQINTLENIDFYITAFQKVQENIDTDISILEAVQHFDEYKNNSIMAGNVLSNENFLYNSTSNTGQSILLPKSGNYQEFQHRLLELV
jgi:LCP family protein required for cell wall assembly